MRRKGRLRWGRVATVLFAVAAGAFVLDTLADAGTFRRIEPHFDGTCTRVDGTVGAEDMAIDRRSGRVYIAACDRRAWWRGKPTAGHVWAYDLRAEAPTLVDLTPDAGPSLQPHGIGFWQADDGGQDAVYVVSHPTVTTHAIEVYDVVPGGLTHRASLTDPLLTSPNDVAAVGRDELYVSIDHGSNGPGLARTVEEYLRLPLGTVVHLEDGTWRTVVEGLTYPNGVAASPDGRTLYVAASTELAVHVFDRDPATGDLTRRDVFEAGSGVDNIVLGADGSLWIGAHPKLLTFAAHWDDASTPSPSQVLRLVPREGGGADVHEILVDDGSQLSGSSVAVQDGQRLLVGPVLDPGLLDCRMGVATDR